MRADSSDNVVSLFNRKPSDKVTKKDKESSDEIEESSDLLYHFLVLLADQGLKLEDIESRLMERHHTK